MHAGWGQFSIETGNNQYEQDNASNPFAFSSYLRSSGDILTYGSSQDTGIQSAGMGGESHPATLTVGLTVPEPDTAAAINACTLIASQPAAALVTAGQSASGATEQSTSNSLGQSLLATSLSRPSVPVTAGWLTTEAAAIQSVVAQEDAVAAAIAAAKQTSAFAGSVAAKMAGFCTGNSTPLLMSVLQEVMETLLPNVSYNVASLHNYGSPVVVLMFPDMVTAQWAERQMNGKQHDSLQLSLQLVPDVHAT